MKYHLCYLRSQNLTKKSKKIKLALKKSIPIVNECFAFDCIINQYYDFTKHTEYFFTSHNEKQS